ncbi:hypothetical protein EBR77_00150 [bacterium]|nr:hypothetical protein [bacterium]NBX78089.1 hypothetical protein [bacterium]
MKNIFVVCLGICFGGVLFAADCSSVASDLQTGPRIDQLNLFQAKIRLQHLQITPGPRTVSKQYEVRALENRIKYLEERQ